MMLLLMPNALHRMRLQVRVIIDRLTASGCFSAETKWVRALQGMTVELLDESNAAVFIRGRLGIPIEHTDIRQIRQVLTAAWLFAGRADGLKREG